MREIETRTSEGTSAMRQSLSKAVTRAQLEKPYNYKKKAHEEQARFNDQVSACIREPQGSIATNDETPAQKRAQEALEKGAQLLAERQKLIKIADRSETTPHPLMGGGRRVYGRRARRR